MPQQKNSDSFTFTVGKLDAGMAILLGERAHLIEFPSILLPPGVTAGSIVNIAVHQNHAEEKKRDTEFWALQEEILNEFGASSPEPPKLQLRNVTQTSVTLEWPQLLLATAKLRSLDIYKNGQRLASIPSPLTNTSTKLSGLDINAEYTFQLILRTTAGTYPSNLIRMRTHTMTDTSGISVCFGNVQDSVLLENAKMALQEMKAKWSDKIQIDTTHFVCTTPAATASGAQVAGNAGTVPGVEYQRALQLSIPIVQPHWILACHSERKMVPIASYYLGANPTTPTSSTFGRHQSMSQASLSRTQANSPPSQKSSNRSSLPPPSRTPASSPPSTSTFANQTNMSAPDARTKGTARFEPTPEEDVETDDVLPDQNADVTRKRRSGTMNRGFKFPPSRNSSSSTPQEQGAEERKQSEEKAQSGEEGGKQKESSIAQQPASAKAIVLTPSSIEVPPPPPVEKERSVSSSVEDGEDDVGDTVDIPLN
ncbi:hypothetical protein AMATHDRAFT_81537 [Amanita thiersii Skay4041]|uniref:Fibronectin type-III domain-containing protein n=1 Tax=Amanita thiersii Skay4041 TaxID=703135 RepID=A0A2A9NL01_9AGAR|nr:hypothetical protein AMATHDRAFT_81537 [Amanita thiersii Skay4041]